MCLNIKQIWNLVGFWPTGIFLYSGCASWCNLKVIRVSSCDRTRDLSAVKQTCKSPHYGDTNELLLQAAEGCNCNNNLEYLYNSLSCQIQLCFVFKLDVNIMIKLPDNL